MRCLLHQKLLLKQLQRHGGKTGQINQKECSLLSCIPFFLYEIIYLIQIYIAENKKYF